MIRRRIASLPLRAAARYVACALGLAVSLAGNAAQVCTTQRVGNDEFRSLSGTTDSSIYAVAKKGGIYQFDGSVEIKGVNLLNEIVSEGVILADEMEVRDALLLLVIENVWAAALRDALRDVVRHCIHGVDINPMAVELCKVALWMETLDPGKPPSPGNPFP